MPNASLVKTCVEILFMGPRLSWRIVKMAIAAARVVRHRGHLLLRAPKTQKERREYRTMIVEKIQGGGEATSAYVRSFNSAGTFSAKAVISATIAALNAGFSLFHRHASSSFFSRCLRFSLSVGWLFIVVPIQFNLFLSKLVLNSTEPLAKRVTANAKRLSKSAPIKN